MRFFPPETRVWTSVTFTKCLYAMLVHRNYQPDHRTGWSLPLIGDSKRTGSDLGMKLVRNFFTSFFILLTKFIFKKNPGYRIRIVG
jgi:hypothetical protein